jgi:hypothetical protein
MMCKGRFDKMAMFRNRQLIMELKSTRDASDWEFSKQVAKLHYEAQASFYRWGAQTITGEAPLHCIIAIENKPPYACSLYMLDDAALQTGANNFRQWLNLYAAAEKANKWPGYPDEVRVLSLPRWANAA